jgi:hypothetical protein
LRTSFFVSISSRSLKSLGIVSDSSRYASFAFSKRWL